MKVAARTNSLELSGRGNAEGRDSHEKPGKRTIFVNGRAGGKTGNMNEEEKHSLIRARGLTVSLEEKIRKVLHVRRLERARKRGLGKFRSKRGRGRRIVQTWKRGAGIQLNRTPPPK